MSEGPVSGRGDDLKAEHRPGLTIFRRAFVQNGSHLGYAGAALGAAAGSFFQFTKRIRAQVDSVPDFGVTYRIANTYVHESKLSLNQLPGS